VRLGHWCPKLKFATAAYRTINTKHHYLGRRPSIRMCRGRTVARVIGRILLTVAALAVTGFMLLVLIGLWDRYGQETAALGFSGIYERYLAWQAGLSVDPKGRAAAKAERARSFEQRPKLVGTGAVGSTSQGMSVALSADGNTAIVGGPGPNNADRDRSPVVGPVGAAWVFTRSGDFPSTRRAAQPRKLSARGPSSSGRS